MIHLDLFSGIGGFSLASDQVFSGMDHVFVERDSFCQAILKKHWPKSKIHGDIRKFITDTERQRWQRQRHYSKGQPGQLDREWENQKPFLLTGGFPCQPFSSAGRKKGTADDRYLWPEMFRVIQLTSPTWVIAENVYGFVGMQQGMVLEQTCTDLEGEGYEVQPFIIPACAVGAPHRRDRVWIIANRSDNGLYESEDTRCSGEGNVCDEEGSDKLCKLERSHPLRPEAPGWDKDWHEVAAKLCGMDDGLSARLGKATISPARHRKEQLRGYGNAIVPQVAVEILTAIKHSS